MGMSLFREFTTYGDPSTLNIAIPERSLIPNIYQANSDIADPELGSGFGGFRVKVGQIYHN